jgi:hypothetical protein
MEQQNKYYTPDISELHVGYECQIGNLFALSGSRWEWAETKPLKWNTISFIAQAMIPEHLVYIRTKYLDQSDIESCGWIHTGGQLISSGRQDYEKAGMMLKYFPRHHSLFIAKAINPDAMDGFAEKLFDGECKSINELRKIMEWLNIK